MIKMISVPLPSDLETVEMWLTRVLKDAKGISHYKLCLSLNNLDEDAYQLVTTFTEKEKYAKNYTSVNFKESEESLQ